MGRRAAILAAAAALFGSTAAHAVTTFVSAVLDRPFVFPGPGDRNPTFNTQFLTPAFPFNPGDTLDITLTFPGGASLDLGFLPASIGLTVFGGFSAPTSTIYQTVGTFAFIDPIGAVNALTGTQSGVSERNPAIEFTGIRQMRRGPLSFDGLHFVVTLDSAVVPFGSPGVPPPATFSAFQVSFLNDVPEPATWAMMIMGFGLTGLAMRRRAVFA